MSFTVTDNEKTGRTEIHLTGCAHNRLSSFAAELTNFPEGTPVREVAKYEGDHNDGIVFAVAPCARKGSDVKAGELFMNDWTRSELGY